MSENFTVEYYFVDAQGSRNGPINEADFIDEIAVGTISPETPVWRTGESDWRPFGAVRKIWFPPLEQEPAGVPVFERLSADTSFGSLFSDTWSFLFSGNNFWMLLAGGILWVLIEAAASTVLGELTTLVVSFISTLVFLLFLRKWDRGEKPEFADLFPLKQFFFLPWLRSLGASVLAGTAIFIPMLIAILIGIGSIAKIAYQNPELLERNTQLTNTLLNTLQQYDTSGQTGKIPQIAIQGEQDADEMLPEVESAEIVFPDSTTLAKEFSINAEIFEELIDGYGDMSEAVIESPIFPIALILSIPFIALSIFLSVRLAFVSYFPLDAETGVIDSLKYSWKLSSGKFWKIFIFGILLGILFLFGTMITLGLGYLILCPYILVAFPVLYAKLIKSRSDLNIPSSRL